MMTTHDLICQKLVEIRPGAAWTFAGETYDGLVWLDTLQAKPTPEELGLA